MATVLGESGAWSEVAANLRRYGFDVHRPNDIDAFLTRLRATYQPSVDRKKSEVAEGVANLGNRIARLRAEKGVWRSFVNWFRVWGCRRTIARLHSEERQYIATLSGNIQRLAILRESSELAGARAELDVIARLARLPVEHTVFNDLRLTADRWIHFEGTPLHSAQIDHLVLSPAGVFVIETKRWSMHFVESGEYHDPFDQIQRAAYLCFDKLRRKFGKIRVRSVIACAGKLPPAPEDTHVKVLPVAELTGYIAWFRQPELAPDRLLKVRHYLEGLMTK